MADLGLGKEEYIPAALMKKILIRVADTIHSLIFAVGCIAIHEYFAARRPLETKVAVIVLISTFALGFLWLVFFRPLLEELKEEPNKASEPTATNPPPSATPPAPLSDLKPWQTK